ncbi:MAG: VWA domain-containing protein, partial [Asticcacaulis sp.]|nr:VWA domain-containing protein [Asticcacaulis sp.]
MQDAQGKNVSGTLVAIVPFNTQVRVGAASNRVYIDFGTEGVSESCSGLNGTVCTLTWDVIDKICVNASNMANSRTNTKAWYTTTTKPNGDVYYTVSANAYETISGGYKNYGYTETYYTHTTTTTTAPYYYTDETGTHYNAGGTSNSTSTNYSSQAATAPYTSSNLNAYNSGPSGGVAVGNGQLTWTVSNSNGFGAATATTTTTKSNGVNRVYAYPAAADTKSKWLGCIIDRTQPYDTQADAPTTANVATLYPARACATTNLKPVQGLSSDIKTARAFVQTLTPGGNTNISIGVQWGMEVLSPTQPFTGGVQFKDEVTRKYMIVVTDGTNTANRWTSTASAIDARTALACENAKKLGITIFVVKVIEGNSDMLRKCASDPAYFYDLTSASQINTALNSAFEAIKKTRLTK